MAKIFHPLLALIASGNDRELAKYVEFLKGESGPKKRLVDQGCESGQTTGIIECRERLDGLLRYYHRRAV